MVSAIQSILVTTREDLVSALSSLHHLLPLKFSASDLSIGSRPLHRWTTLLQPQAHGSIGRSSGLPLEFRGGPSGHGASVRCYFHSQSLMVLGGLL